jgi:hypothetical protein
LSRAVQDETLCECSLWELAPADKVRLCDEHHSYWRGTKRLLSVSHVLRSTWPYKPDFSAAPPGVIENARERGSQVDVLFTRYLRGQLKAFPADTREDSMELFFRLKRWWDGRKWDAVQAQVILADDEIAGMCDVLADDWVYDLKTTHDIEPMYHLQLGAYAQLHFATYQKPVKGIGIIHVTKRYATPKLIKLDMYECLQDWATLRECYSMAARRAGKS